MGVAYRNTVFWVLVQAKPSISPAPCSSCRGKLRDRSGSVSVSVSDSGSSSDPFLSTSLSSPDSGGGAAGSDPDGAGERDWASALRSGFGPESQVHSASARPQLLPNRGIEDILEDPVESDGKSRTPRFSSKGG